MSLRQQILDFVRQELTTGADAESIGEDDNLIDRGIIDSMALMRTVVFIEENMGVRIPDDEVLPDNFETVKTIESLVERLRGK